MSEHQKKAKAARGAAIVLLGAAGAQLLIALLLLVAALCLGCDDGSQRPSQGTCFIDLADRVGEVECHAELVHKEVLTLLVDLPDRVLVHLSSLDLPPSGEEVEARIVGVVDGVVEGLAVFHYSTATTSADVEVVGDDFYILVRDVPLP